MAREDQQSSPEELSPTGTVTVTEPEVDDDADDGGSDGGEQALAPRGDADRSQAQPQGGQRPARAGGRAERRRIWEANERLRSELGEARGQISSLQTTFAQQMREVRDALTSRGAAGPGPATGGQGAGPQTPVQKRLADTRRAMAAEMAAFRSHDQRKGEYDLTRYNELREAETDAMMEEKLENYLREKGIDLSGRQQQRQPNPEEFASEAAMIQIRNTVAGEHPWLRVAGETGDRARRMMGAAVNFLLTSGKPNSLETHREAAADVERRLGLAPRRAPTGNPRRYTEVSDDNRAPVGGRRAVTVPSEMLEGSGLPPEAVRRALFRGQQ